MTKRRPKPKRQKKIHPRSVVGGLSKQERGLLIRSVDWMQRGTRVPSQVKAELIEKLASIALDRSRCGFRERIRAIEALEKLERIGTNDVVTQGPAVSVDNTLRIVIQDADSKLSEDVDSASSEPD